MTGEKKRWSIGSSTATIIAAVIASATAISVAMMGGKQVTEVETQIEKNETNSHGENKLASEIENTSKEAASRSKSTSNIESSGPVAAVQPREPENRNTIANNNEKQEIDNPDSRDPFPEGTLRRLASGKSLLDGATWAMSPAYGDRVLEIDFKVEALISGQGIGMATVKLLDNDNNIVCSISLNSVSSRRSGSKFWGECEEESYIVPAGESRLFRAETSAENATIIRADLRRVYARSRY
jgi:hypothetical protein